MAKKHSVPKPPRPPLPPAPDLGPEDVQYFNSARNRIGQSYQLGRAQNLFNRQQIDLNHALQQGDLTRKLDLMRSRLPGGYARRGLVNSGIYGEGLQRFNTDRVNALASFQRRYDEMAGGLDLENSQLQSVYDQAIADLKAQEEARRAAIRASLQGY